MKRHPVSQGRCARCGQWLAAALVCTSGALLPATAGELAWPAGLSSCATILNDTERLSCYDTVVARSRSKPTAGAEPLVPTREQLFGVRGGVARPERDPVPRERKDLQVISARLVEIRRREESSELVLDNGQVWKALTENETALLKPGDTISISRAAFGSFRLVTPSGRFAKAVRIR